MYPICRRKTASGFSVIDAPRQAECIDFRVRLFRRVAAHWGGVIEFRAGMFHARSHGGAWSVFGLGFPLSGLRAVFAE